MKSAVVIALMAFSVSAMADTQPRGTANLEVTISRKSSRGSSSSVMSFLVPMDGKEHEFQSGHQLPIQTKVNGQTTVSFIDATTRIEATLTSYRSGPLQFVAVSGAVSEVHAMQQLGIPFQLSVAALLDVTRCQGSWLVTKGTPRQLCSWSRRGSNDMEWSASVKLVWQDGAAAGGPLDPQRTSTTEATARIGTDSGERLQSITCDAVSVSPIRCESMHGKQVPVVLDDRGTKTTTYVDATTSIVVSADEAGKTSIVMRDGGLEPPRDISTIGFSQLRSTIGKYDVPPGTAAIDGLTVSRFARSGEKDVTVTLERYRRTVPAVGMKP